MTPTSHIFQADIFLDAIQPPFGQPEAWGHREGQISAFGNQNGIHAVVERGLWHGRWPIHELEVVEEGFNDMGEEGSSGSTVVGQRSFCYGCPQRAMGN